MTAKSQIVDTGNDISSSGFQIHHRANYDHRLIASPPHVGITLSSNTSWAVVGNRVEVEEWARQDVNDLNSQLMMEERN